MLFPGNFAPKHLDNHSQSLVFGFPRNVPTRLKHHFIFKAVMSFESVAANLNFASVPMCQRVNVVRFVPCHPRLSFLAKALFTTVNLVRRVTVHNVITSVNSAHSYFVSICALYYTHL